jgi:SAM-dependent methyltransferase
MIKADVMWTNAMNVTPSFSYRVAMRRNCLSFDIRRSTQFLSRYAFLSSRTGSTAVLRNGITGLMPSSNNESRIACGPGNFTRNLIKRWPSAQVVGVDNFPEMLEQARSHAVAGQLEFVQADIASWTADKLVDLIVSNAACAANPSTTTLHPSHKLLIVVFCMDWSLH